jgi:hypothetical protein
MEFVGNLGHPISKKTVTIEKLSKGGFVICGTPQLSFEEMNELIGVLNHQIEFNSSPLIRAKYPNPFKPPQ